MIHRQLFITFVFFLFYSLNLPVPADASTGRIHNGVDAGSDPVTSLYLNEIMASNATTIYDEDGDNPDWIEIYYEGDEPISLRFFGLSDDPDKPFQWHFPDTTIHPGEYMLVWASGKDRNIPGAPLHTNFAIAMEGEDIILSHPLEGPLDYFSAREVPTDVSVGRVPDGHGDWYFFNDPTPGASNTTEFYDGLTDPPGFSHPPGFHESDFELVIEPPDDSTTIYYTLDGSEPTVDSPIYSKPLVMHDRSDDPNVFSTIRTSNRTFDWRQWYEPQDAVSKGTIVRVMTQTDGRLPVYSNKTFFVMPEGTNRYELPVISITTDSLSLFDYETGIYVPGIHYAGAGTGNFFQRGIEWEREATFEYFNEQGDRVLHHNIGIRIHGGFSRQLAQKSLRLYARNEYGESRFNYPFFKDLNDDQFNRLILRNSGNTWGEDMFMDAAAQSLVRHFNVDTQAYQPAVLFLNGEFWGIHNIRERYDKHYLERVYGVDPENIDMLTRNRQVKEGDALHYTQTIDFITDTDLSDDAAFARAATKIDLDNLLDYYSAQVYYGNNDWPQNNIDYWRARVPFDPDAPAGRDGRWRWLLFDVDRSLGHETGPEFDMLDWITRSHIWNQEWPNLLLLNLLENEQFTHDFINRMADHLNSAFMPDRVKQVVDSLKSPVESVIQEHIDRWSLPQNVSDWKAFVDEMYRFADERPGHQREHIITHFGLAGADTIQLDVTHPKSGQIRVNTLIVTPDTPGIPQDVYPWTGIYFSGVPVTLTAISKPDHEFLGWRIDGSLSSHSDSVITIHPETESEIKALFSQPTGITSDDTPHTFELHQNYPNPFNSSTVITFDLPERSDVRLEVFDVLGRRVTNLTQGTIDAGRYRHTWDATGVSSGVYVMRLLISGSSNSPDHALTGKMLLIK